MYCAIDEPEVARADLKPQKGQPVALGGYCPVSLVDRGQRVLGRPLYWWIYDGHTYYCADTGAGVRFINNPSRFAQAAEDILAGTRPIKTVAPAAEQTQLAEVTKPKSETTVARRSEVAKPSKRRDSATWSTRLKNRFFGK